MPRLREEQERKSRYADPPGTPARLHATPPCSHSSQRAHRCQCRVRDGDARSAVREAFHTTP